MQFKIDVQKGVIRSAAVYGDFFSTVDAGAISAALAGCRYARADVLEALRAHGLDGAVCRISAADMAAVIADGSETKCALPAAGQRISSFLQAAPRLTWGPRARNSGQWTG